MQDILLGLFLGAAIWVLIHIIGVISDGKFMDWIEYYKKKWKMSNFTAGETIQALGTSAPEISISILGLYIMGENPALGLATIIGSAIFQITVVIGVPIFFAKDGVKLDPKGLIRTALVYGGSVLLLALFLWTDAALSWWELVVLSIYHIIYVAYLILGHKKTETEEDKEFVHPELPPAEPKVLNWIDKGLEKIPGPEEQGGLIGKFPLGFLITLAAIGVACAFFIQASVEFATLIGVSSTLIALTVLAGGSSVPELFSNIPLAKKGNIDQAIGNAFGSNTLDICISFALVSIPYAIFVGDIKGAGLESMVIPIAFLFGYLFVVLAIFASTNFTTQKWQGWVLNTLFIIFVAVSYAFGV